MCITKIFNLFRKKRLTAAPPTDKTLGIDTSHWNGYFDFAKAKSKGVKFVIQKICDVNASGTAMFYDIKAEANYISAKGNGMIFGGYAWLNPFFDVNAQAQFYINWYKSHDADLPPVLDFEDTHFVNANDYIAKAQQWLSIVEAATGKTPIIYTAEWFMSKFNRANTAWMGQYHLWVAHYTSRTYPTVPREWSEYKIWQYSDRGTYPYYEAVSPGKGKEWGSTSYSLDMNWFNGTYGKLLEFCNIGGEEPLPEPPVEPPASEVPLYKAVVTTTPPYRLRVRKTPNGEFIRWLNSGDKVSVYEEAVDWLRINPNEWISSNPNWVQRLPDEGQIADGLFNVQLWSQRDPRWAGDRMGASYITLGQEGCLVTSVASVLNFLGIDTDPKRYNQLLTERNGYQSPNKMYWQMPDVLWAGQVARAEYKTYYGTGWESAAQAIIDDGRPALAQVDFVPGGVMNQHWVVLIGKINGVWWCYDPWYGSIAALNARYNGIYRIVSYKKL